MKHFLLFASLFSAMSASSQQLEWVKAVGTPTFETIRSITHDPEGNLYASGLFQTTTDFDPGPGTTVLTSTGEGNYTGFIMKMDPAGNLIWAKTIAGTQVFNESIAVDYEGNVYTCGYFLGNADFNPGPATANLNGQSGRGYVCKWDQDGNYVWAKMFSGSENTPYKLAIKNQSIYVSGSFVGTVDFDLGSGTHNLTATGGGLFNFDTFIAKFDLDGNFLLAKQFGGSGSDTPDDLLIDEDENLYLSMRYASNDFNPGNGNLPRLPNGTHLFMAKLDSNANYVWHRHIVNPHQALAGGLAIDLMGNLFVTSVYNAATDVNPGNELLTFPGNGIFVEKLDNSGNFLWARNIQANAEAKPQSAGCDQDGNFYLLAKSATSVSFGSVPATFPNTDNFYCKYNPEGELAWALAGYKNYDAFYHRLSVLADGAFYVGGNFRATSDFDPGIGTQNLTSAGAGDIFIAKISSDNLGIPTNPAVGFDLLISETGNELHYKSEVKMEVQIFDIAGRNVDRFELSESNGFEYQHKDLPSGAYIAHMRSNDRFSSKKFLKK